MKNKSITSQENSRNIERKRKDNKIVTVEGDKGVLKPVQETIASYKENELEDEQHQEARRSRITYQDRDASTTTIPMTEILTHPKIVEHLQYNEEPTPPVEDHPTESESYPAANFPKTTTIFNPRRVP
eukprot:snap_masked-scaffold_3-processed-gene-14.21-mRNA-1 protein AED:1.00 eAED:1.00 QI:0/-1/0/0/-1/1/1/0/127